MRICLMVEGQEGVSWDEWVALARACEEHGLAGLFRSDHYESGLEPERGSLDAWTTIAALGPITERIRLGTMVSPVTFRHPAHLARAVVTADHASGGRVELGLGAGWMEREHRANGFPFPDMTTRLAMLREQLEIVVRQWTEQEFSFAGVHYRLASSGARPKPLQRPRPRIIVGGSGARGTVEPAVRWADEYDAISKSPDEIRELRGRLDRLCEDAGRDRIALSLMTTTVVGEGEDELRDRAAAFLRRVGRETPVDEWLGARRGTGLVGTVDEVRASLEAYRKAGLDGAYLQHLDHRDLEPVRLIGTELVPALA